MEHAHPSHAHVVLQMSLAQWLNFELKSYAQIEHQCIVSSLWGVGGQEPTNKRRQKAKLIVRILKSHMEFDIYKTQTTKQFHLK